MRASRQEQTGGAGLSHVREKFEDINWGPIENAGHDLGVDLFLQVRDWRRFDAAVLVCAQVKSGNAKYFNKPERDESGEVVGWWYTDDDAEHFDDWSRHGLPHLLVIVTDGPDRTAYWVHITENKIRRTGKGCKILVPKAQRIDHDNIDALMEAAATGKATPDLQGFVYRAGPQSVPPGRTLRHALLAPRMIAPRDREYDRTLVPEEAIALITAGRGGELDRYSQERVFLKDQVPPAARNRDLVAASSQSKDWRWRMFHAVCAFAADRDSVPAVDLAASTAASTDEPIERRAASAVVAAVALMDAEQWTQATEVLDAVGEDLPPVDHGWVLTHRALVHLERNDVGQARAAAAEALRAAMTDPDDVTARAISSAASWILIITTKPGRTEATESAAGKYQPHLMLDTAAGWWRAMEVAEAQDQFDDITFRTWASAEDLGTTLSEDSQDRLTGAWLTALFAGSRSESGWPLSLQARHEIQHLELEWRGAHGGNHLDARVAAARSKRADAVVARIGEVLDALRRYGRIADLERAADRLWKSGPAESVRDVLLGSLDRPWRPSTARTDVALLTSAGDLLDVDAADKAVRRCLAVLGDVAAFRRLARPTFLEWHYFPRAMRRVLTAASVAAQAEVLDFVLARVPDGDPDLRGDLEAMVVNLHHRVIAADAERVRAVVLEHEGSLSATLLRKLVAAGDPTARDELRRRSERGDIDAASAIGRVAELSESAAQALLRDSVADCRRVIADAATGAFAEGGDSARNLVTLNLAFPRQGDWATVLDLLCDPLVPADAKLGAVAVMTNAGTIPDEVLDLFRDRMAVKGPHVIGSVFGLMVDVEAYDAQAYAFAVTIGVLDNSQAVVHVLSLLRGSTSQRRSAYTVISALGRKADDPFVQGALIMLTTDPQHEIRGAAAAALVRGLTPGTSPQVEQAIEAAASEPGCAVPLRVAQTMASTPGAFTNRDALRNRLATHLSARVRRAVRGAEG